MQNTTSQQFQEFQKNELSKPKHSIVHSPQVQAVIDKLKSGQMQFVC